MANTPIEKPATTTAMARQATIFSERDIFAFIDAAVARGYPQDRDWAGGGKCSCTGATTLAAAKCVLLGNEEAGVAPPKTTKHTSTATQSPMPADTSLRATR